MESASFAKDSTAVPADHESRETSVMVACGESSHVSLPRWQLHGLHELHGPHGPHGHMAWGLTITAPKGVAWVAPVVCVILLALPSSQRQQIPTWAHGRMGGSKKRGTSKMVGVSLL